MKRVGVITDNRHIAKICEDFFQNQAKMSTVIASNVRDFREQTSKATLHGILIDMKSFLRAESDDRWFINNLGEFMPLAKIRLPDGSNEIAGLIDSGSDPTKGILHSFTDIVTKLDRGFQLRRFERRPVILNVQVFHKMWKKGPLLTNSVDLSPGGIFLVAGEHPPRESLVEIKIMEIPRSPSLNAVVRWSLPWGKSTNHYAGFGIEFIELTPKQITALQKL